MKKLSAFLAISALSVASMPLFAETWHEVPGSSCASFNNAQADLLTRDHVRIFLPATSPKSLFVICPLDSVLADMDTADPPEGWLNTFFDEGVETGAEVSCIVRQFGADTTHFPGRATAPAPDAAVGVVSTKSLPATDAEAVFDYFLMPVDYDQYDFYTVTCLLAPGTGINSISFHQR